MAAKLHKVGPFTGLGFFTIQRDTLTAMLLCYSIPITLTYIIILFQSPLHTTFFYSNHTYIQHYSIPITLTYIIILFQSALIHHYSIPITLTYIIILFQSHLHTSLFYSNHPYIQHYSIPITLTYNIILFQSPLLTSLFYSNQP